VPTFGFGMSDRGPRIFPKGFNFGNISGVVNKISKSVFPLPISASASLSINLSTPEAASCSL